MRRKGTRRLQFESLENRQLLAGDVNVSVVAGQLFVTGDQLENDIELTSTGVAGQFRIASGTFSPTTKTYFEPPLRQFATHSLAGGVDTFSAPESCFMPQALSLISPTNVWSAARRGESVAAINAATATNETTVFM